jgi:hypothetical protein
MSVTARHNEQANGNQPWSCPPWCAGEHLGQADDDDGFHHDGPVTTIWVEHPVTAGRGQGLLVNVSLHVRSGARDEPSYVEIQDALQTLALLTPVECLALSRALLEAAATVADESQLESIRRERLLEEVERALNEGLVPLVGVASTG